MFPIVEQRNDTGVQGFHTATIMLKKYTKSYYTNVYTKTERILKLNDKLERRGIFYVMAVDVKWSLRAK